MTTALRPRWILAVVAALGTAALTGACVPPAPAPAPPVVRSFAAAGAPFAAPALVPFAWKVTDANKDELTCRLDLDDDGTWDEVIAPCPSVGSRNASLGEGARRAVLEVSDPTHAAVRAVATVAVGPGPGDAGYDIELRTPVPLPPELQAAMETAIGRWEAVFARGVPDEAVALPAGACGADPIDGVVDDLVLVVQLADPGGGFAASAGPCTVGGDHLSRTGIITFDPTQLPFAIQYGLLEDLAAHELGHVLGVGSLWMSWGRALIEGSGTGDPRFIGPRTVAVWSALGRSGGVPVENLYAHQIEDHWRENAPDGLVTELMTPYLGTGAHPLSMVTIASLADLGYHVDPAAAEPYAPPAQGLTAERLGPAPVLADRVVDAQASR